ncbi:hypothetical protein [uncultured Desulfuromonas sp.]|uniref:hypothetical protein n=1 Tax=uncultured Desulfuromonas sp. TaxID=181013 RepID=UPI002AABDC07|nr:hypothetical protein [uncultured Desulfuromonas sp.]
MERLCQRMRHVTQVAAYSLYLYKVQNGLPPRCSIYAEPAISRRMEELNIPVRMIPDNCEAQVASC